MFNDQSLLFTGTNWSTAATISATTTSTIVDLTGAGSGTAPAMIGGYPAKNTAMGFDIGVGDGEAIPQLYVAFTTAGTGAGNVTLALSAAPDNGSYGQGSYTQLWASIAITGTNIPAGGVIVVPVPPFPLALGKPRFYKLVYTVSSTFSATVIAGLVINAQSSLVGANFSSNFLAV